MKRSEIKKRFPGVDPGRISLLPVLDQFHEGVIITDPHGVILYMNETQLRIDDLRINDAIGRTVTELYRVDEGTSPTMTCLKTGKAIENLAGYYRTHLGKVVNSVHNIYPLRADGRLIGAHTDLLAAMKAAQLASDSPSTSMVFGETGTGKEMFVQSIRNHSARKNRP